MRECLCAGGPGLTDPDDGWSDGTAIGPVSASLEGPSGAPVPMGPGAGNDGAAGGAPALGGGGVPRYSSTGMGGGPTGGIPGDEG